MDCTHYENIPIKEEILQVMRYLEQPRLWFQDNVKRNIVNLYLNDRKNICMDRADW